VNPAPPIVYSSPPTSTNIGSSVTPGMKIQPKPALSNSANLANQLNMKNSNQILSPLTQHLQAALKQHQAIQQQQMLSQQLQNVFLQQQQQQQAAAAAAVAARNTSSPHSQKPSELMANRLQSIIRSQAATLGLIRPASSNSAPNVILNSSNLAGVIQKQPSSSSLIGNDNATTTANILKSVLEQQQQHTATFDR